ncbi:MAG: hypothetical protein HY461_00315 [Parcubacteria group bacterium]|nr:hypothetical protein [Parcubacteria group bacterium]
MALSAIERALVNGARQELLDISAADLVMAQAAKDAMEDALNGVAPPRVPVGGWGVYDTDMTDFLGALAAEVVARADFSVDALPEIRAVVIAAPVPPPPPPPPPARTWRMRWTDAKAWARAHALISILIVAALLLPAVGATIWWLWPSDTKQAEIAAKNAEITSLKQEALRLTQQRDAADQAKAAANQTANAAQRDKAAAETAASTARAKVARVTSELNAANKEIGRIRKAESDCQAHCALQLEGKNKELERATARVSMLESMVTGLQGQIASLMRVLQKTTGVKTGRLDVYAAGLDRGTDRTIKLYRPGSTQPLATRPLLQVDAPHVAASFADVIVDFYFWEVYDEQGRYAPPPEERYIWWSKTMTGAPTVLTLVSSTGQVVNITSSNDVLVILGPNWWIKDMGT